MSAANRVVLLGLAVAAMVASTVPIPVQTSTAAATHRALETGGVTVVLDRVMPTVPRPGRTLGIAGRVVNGTEQRLTDLSVNLHASATPVGTRSELAQTAQADDADALDRADSVVPGTRRPVRGPLNEGEEARFFISVPLNRLGLSDFGVYVMSVEVTGAAGVGLAPASLDSVTTFLPWVPTGSGIRATRLALLWPLVGMPSRDGDGVFGSDVLGTTLARGGRLRSLLESAAGFDVAWMVDPELLEAVSDMADGYEVRKPPSETASGQDTGSADDSGLDSSPSAPPGKTPHPDTVPGDYQDEAKAWLERLRTELEQAEVNALPYADPDLVALRRTRGLASDLTLATTTGQVTAAEVLQRDVPGDLVWPPAGQVNQATLEALRVAGAQTVVLDGTARPAPADLTYTPTGRARVSTIGGPMDVALSDVTLSSLFHAPSTTPGSALLARQRFLAETAMITAERPGDGRAVLAAPPRHWRPDPRFARSLLSSLARVPWVRRISLDEMLARPVPNIDREPLRYETAARRAELPAAHLRAVREMRVDLRDFASILDSRAGDATAPLDLAILRTESSAWRGHLRAGRQLREQVRDELDARRGSVYVAADRLVTLTSKRGRFPVTIANDLDQTVDVELTLTPRQQARMSVRSPVVPRIEGGRKITIEVPAEARANGVVTVDAQLRTPSGDPYGAPVPIAVRATDYGTIAYVITGGALVVLFSAAGFRIIRRARAARARSRVRSTAAGANEGKSDA